MPRLFCLPLLIVAAAGCGPYLQYTAQPRSPTPSGKIIVDVRDNREPKFGGEKKNEVGIQSGAFDLPSTIRVESGTTVADTMRRLIGDAALAAGVGVAATTDDPGATARVVVEVTRLWCTGYRPAYRADITVNLSIADPTGREVRLPPQAVHAENGGLDCRRGYQRALTEFLNNTKALFATEQVKTFATGVGRY
jgi:hypothetical protein